MRHKYHMAKQFIVNTRREKSRSPHSLLPEFAHSLCVLAEMSYLNVVALSILP